MIRRGVVGLAVALVAASLSAAPIPGLETTANPSLVASATATKPATILPGDLQILAPNTYDDGVPNTVSGFTSWGLCNGNVFDSRLQAKLLTDSDASVTSWSLTATGGTVTEHWTTVVRNVDPTTPVDFGDCVNSDATGTATTFSISGTTTVANTLLVGTANCATGVSFTPPSNPATWTELVDTGGTWAGTLLWTSSGSTGTITLTTSAGTDCFFRVIAVRPNTVGIRLYLDSATSPSVTPADFASAWDSTGSALTRTLVATAGSSAFTATGVTKSVSTNNYDIAIYRGVYGPLGAGSISGLFRGVLLALESNASMNAVSQVTMRLLKSDGTERSVIFSGVTSTATSSEWATGTAANRFFPRPNVSRAMTTVRSENGDYLEVTLGCRANTTGTSYTCTIRHGDNAGSDLSQAESGTTDNRPWIQIDTGLPVYAVPHAGQPLQVH